MRLIYQHGRKYGQTGDWRPSGLTGKVGEGVPEAGIRLLLFDDDPMGGVREPVTADVSHIHPTTQKLMSPQFGSTNHIRG